MDRRRVLVASAAVGLVNALTFRWLFLYFQELADSGATAAPTWSAITWPIVSFPGRYLYYIPALNHPFGFGEHEDLTLALVALFNGLIWGVVAWLALSFRLVRRN